LWPIVILWLRNLQEQSDNAWEILDLLIPSFLEFSITDSPQHRLQTFNEVIVASEAMFAEEIV